jgi:hypothetical protein
MNSLVTTLTDCGILTSGVLILVAAAVLLEKMPTVPVRASCVPLTGQAPCTAAPLASAALCVVALAGGGRDALGCAGWAVDAERGLLRGASTTTGRNGAEGSCAVAGLGA